jgi:hypothetical protein
VIFKISLLNIQYCTSLFEQFFLFKKLSQQELKLKNILNMNTFNTFIDFLIACIIIKNYNNIKYLMIQS